MIPMECDFDIPASKALAHQLNEEETENIEDTVKYWLANKADNKEKIRKFRDENIYNFGKAGAAAADAIIQIQKNLTSEVK